VIFRLMLVSWLIGWSLAAHAAAPSAPEQLAALARDVAAIEAARDSLVTEARQKQGQVAPPLVAQLRFANLISFPARHGHLGKSDLEITLRRNGDRWLLGTASASQWHPGPSFVDGAGLSLKDNRLDGTVRVHLSFARGGFQHHCIESQLDIRITAAIAGGKIEGTYLTAGVAPLPDTPWTDHTSDGQGWRIDSSPVPARQGAVSGTTRLAAMSPAVPQAPRSDLEEQWSAGAARKACWLEAKAVVAYRQIYACALAIDAGLALEHAWELSPSYAIERPEMKADKPAPKPSPTPGKRPKPGGKGASPVTPKNTDLPDIGQPKDPFGDPDSAKRPDDAEDEKKLLSLLRPVAAHVAAMRRIAQGYRPGGPALPVVVGNSPCDDPTFGPWFGEEPLTGTKDSPNAVSAQLSTPGPVEWRRIAGWRFVGPFTATFRDCDAPALPEVVPAWDLAEDGTSAYSAPATQPQAATGPALVKKDSTKDDDEEIPDVPPPEPSASQFSGLGHTHPPTWLDPEKGGRALGIACMSYYGAADLTLADEKELWLGITVNDGGALWINDRLVWKSPMRRNPRSESQTWLLKARLVKGVNRLVFRGDNHIDDTFLSVWVCARGGPQAPDVARKQQEKVARAYESTPPSTARGWRGDWTGKFAPTAPPVAWDVEKGINVLWRKKMDSSHATPVIVGDRLFTCLEPHTLVCMNKNDGSILWQRNADIVELRDPALREEAKKAREQADKAEAQLAALGATKDERIKALTATGLSAAQADERLRELGRLVNQRREILRKAGVSGPAWGLLTGHTISTPVTDGKHVWVKYNTGALACFDLDGNRKWMVDHGCSTGTNTHVPSPLLVAGRLIVMLPDAGFGTVFSYQTVTTIVRGYDPQTGKLLWTARPAAGVCGEVTGTPVAMRLANGDETLDVIVTANGSVVRAQDGKILRMHLGTREKYGSPVTDGRNIVYITGPASKAAYELILRDRDQVGVRTLWHVYHPGVGYDSGNYGLVHDGLLYAFGWRLDILDAVTGDILAMRHEPLWIRPGRCYAPLALAGGHVYFADFGQFFAQPMGRHHGSGMSVAQTGRDGLILARNRVDLMTAGPCFEADRIYLRNHAYFTCLGYTGDEGRAFEAQAIARELLSQLFPDRPGSEPAIALAARRAPGADAWQNFASMLWAKDIPDAWAMLGPVAHGQAQAVREELLKAELANISGNREGMTAGLVAGQKTCSVLHGYNAKTWKKDGRLSFAGAGAGEGVHFFMSVVRNDFRRFLRVELDAPGTRLFIGGVEVRHNQVLDVPEGQIALLLESAVPANVAENAGVKLRLWPSRGPDEDVADWQAGIKRRAEYLQNAVRLSPQSDAGRKAKAALEQGLR
jgi:hypothetical protein